MKTNNKSKVGILTFHRAVNYGAVLQSFALCNALKEIGADAELIDYECTKIYEMDSLKKRLKNGGLKKGVEYILLKKNRDIRKKKLTYFLENNTSISSVVYKRENISESNSIYDSFITGSDQVWNVNRTDNDLTYYLDFVKDTKKKNSYAASIGNITNDKKRNIEKYLNDFNNISVRESDGKDAVEQILNKKINLVVDPTFLLKKQDWMKYARIPSEKNYILVYTLAKSPELREFARKLSQKTNLPIIDLSVRAENFRGMKKVADAGIEDFLGYFANAQYVVTNSFHGTAFSIIMEKTAYVGLHKDVSMGNSRMETLLNTFGLEEYIISPSNSNEIMNKNIDYVHVSKRLEEEREKAISYLKEIVS